MAFLEWRKFNFFEIKKNIDEGKLSELCQDAEITVTTSGNNQLILCDSIGRIHIVSRSCQKITTVKGYEIRVQLAQQLRNSPILVTIGEDELGINPLIKVWDTSKPDKNGGIYCYRISRAVPNNRAIPASTLCVHDNLQLMAVGFNDGSLILYRGDITRERSSRQKLLRDTSSLVTGLAFKSTASSIYLYMSTECSVYVYNVTHKDKEIKSQLDSTGCALRCNVLAESIQESHFMIGRNDAIYCYTYDGRGPCYAVDGEKVMIEWFRSYLIIIAMTARNNITNVSNNGIDVKTSNDNAHTLIVLDIQNKFIVYSAPIQRVKAILKEWGAFYILDVDNKLHHLDEKDLQSKLMLLFKKNLYDVAIRIAKSQQYDTDGLVDIFRQYGDHLYNKGDHSGAIEQYIKTIGKLEPSYVIRKFLESQHIDKLTLYLQALHKQGQATEDHTTLLLNCFTKLNRNDNLKEFILMKDRDLDFDIDIAIKVCRQGSPQEALMLAKKHRKHDWYIKLLIEDHAKYGEVIEYVSNLNFDDAEHYMKKYGNVLIENVPNESTQFLKRLCTDYKSYQQSAIIMTDTILLNGGGGVAIMQKSDPEDYIHLFLNNSKRLVEFLEYLIAEGTVLSTPVYDTLLEHYLHVWESLNEGPEREKYADKTLKLLQNPDAKCDKAQALIVCHMHGFSKGILHLYEEQKLYQQLLRYHMARQDSEAVLACCRRGQEESSLWVQALWSCVRETREQPKQLLHEILNEIANKRLLSPQLVIEAIGTAQSNITLAHIRNYITNEFNKELNVIKRDQECTDKYKKDIEKLKEHLENLKTGTTVIQGSRCAACHHQLELPSVHFMCQHSYHQYCFQSFSENENECPACVPRNQKLLEMLKARENTKDLHETFHSDLEKACDGFSTAGEYYGRGVFNKVKVITDVPMEKQTQKSDNINTKQKPREIQQQQQQHHHHHSNVNYGLGAEARIRQMENARSGAAIIPTPEGRIRLQESNKYSSSLEANITKITSSVDSRQSYVSNVENPFDNDYDETKNPFADDESDETNPFNDDYDKNLNPFSS